MNNNTLILSQLIDEDFELQSKDGSKWGKSYEHDSLVLDKNRGVFFWNSKGIVGDPLVYLTKVRGMNFQEARLYLEKYDYEGTHVYSIKSKKQEDVIVYPRLVDIFYELGEKNRDYFYRRSITDLTIDKYQLGWYNDYYMIPFFEDGTFRNFQMRKDNPVKKIRSYYRDVGPLLFNSDVLRVADTIYYTEGPIDAMILLQNGLPAIASNCGGGYLNEWMVKFSKAKSIFMLFDNDEAGVIESRKLSKFLGTSRCRIYTFDDFEEKGYDPVDFFRDGHTVDELLDLVEKQSKKIN